MRKAWIVWLWLAALPAGANELELYTKSAESVPTRIMLLLDTSDSMSMTLAGGGFTEDFAGDCSLPANEQRKICILKDTLAEFIDANELPANATFRWGDHVEVGLARYAQPGSLILADMRALDEVYTLNGVTQSHRQHLQRALDTMTLSGWTPLVGSYFETIQYLVGGDAVSQDSIDHSVDPEGSTWSATPGVYAGQNLQVTCKANNHVVVLTDGESTNERMSAAPQHIVGSYTLGQRINRFVTGTNTSAYHDNCDATINADSTNPFSRPTPEGYWGCTNILAEKLLDLTLPGSGETSIKTHTIAYNLGAGPADRLAAWAEAGEGLSRLANSAAELRSALSEIGDEIIRQDSFTATVPGVGINQSNRFTHLDDLYFSVFAPSERPFWYGNLKKYRLGVEDNSLVIFGRSYGSTSPTRNADENEDGFFDKNVFDLWFDSALYPDSSYAGVATTGGDAVPFGGAASRIAPASERNLFTTSSANNTVNLKTESVRDALKATVLGVTPSAPTEEEQEEEEEYDRFLAWLRGEDANDANNEWRRLVSGWNDDVSVSKTDRTLYGAPIHSAPVVVNYTSMNQDSDGKNVPLDPADQENLVFISTNDGKLYGVDAAAGDEKLSFMPSVFLQRGPSGQQATAERMYQAARSEAPGELIYGLDSTWTVWRQDVNRDGNITDGSSNDFVYLFGGMRRGGRNYYGLDMTGAMDGNMEQRFVLEGGVANTAFENLGQTWSEPVLALIKYNGVNRVVMIVGGGYDPLYDSARPTSANPMGNAIYLVVAYGANAGEVLWWSSASGASEPGNHVTNAALADSIPSSVKVLDRDGDGFVDHFYVGDLGGQIHRFDIKQVSASSTTITHDLVAQLGRRGDSEDAEDDRRFFFPPSVALMADGAQQFVGIAMGSGLMTSPNDAVVDERFFFIKDSNPFAATPLSTLRTGDATLVDLPIQEADGSAVTGSPAAPSSEQLAAARGFSMPLLMDAEKFLGSPLILNGTVVFTTYSSEAPEDAENTGQCVGGTGSAALYSYTPGQSFATQRNVRLPQTLAGNIGVLFPSSTVLGEGSGSSDLRDVQGWAGGPSGAIDLPDVNTSNIRKTRWIQCRDAACD